MKITRVFRIIGIISKLKELKNPQVTEVEDEVVIFTFSDNF